MSPAVVAVDSWLLSGGCRVLVVDCWLRLLHTFSGVEDAPAQDTF